MELKTTWNLSDIFQHGQNRIEEQATSHLGSLRALKLFSLEERILWGDLREPSHIKRAARKLERYIL